MSAACGTLLVGQLPELDCAIDTGREEIMAVGTESHGTDPIGMALMRVEFKTKAHIPKFDHLIAAAGSQQLAIGAESDGADGGGMAQQCAFFLHALSIPQFDSAIASCRGDV